MMLNDKQSITEDNMCRTKAASANRVRVMCSSVFDSYNLEIAMDQSMTALRQHSIVWAASRKVQNGL